MSSKISCSSCEWVSKGTGLDAEIEFDQHVEEVHMKHEEPNYDKQDAQSNIEISAPEKKSHSYGIYLKGSSVSSCGRSYLLDEPDLLEDGDKKYFTEEQAVEVATRIAQRLGIKSIYISKGHYPSKLVRMIKVDKPTKQMQKLKVSDAAENVVINIPSEVGDTYSVEVGKKLDASGDRVQDLIAEFANGVFRKDDAVLIATKIALLTDADLIYIKTSQGSLVQSINV